MMMAIFRLTRELDFIFFITGASYFQKLIIFILEITNFKLVTF